MKQTVSRCAAVALSAALLLATAGCKQPDGAMPAPTGEQPNKIEDISRDLQNLAAKDGNAPAELADDLSSLDSMQRPPEKITQLSKELAGALGGTSLSDGDAKRVANLVFVAVSARELSESQIEKVSADLRTTLTALGAQAQAVDRVSATAADLASSVTRNRKRWYHR
jgi:hypothetical protein